MVRYVYDAWGNHKAYAVNGSECVEVYDNVRGIATGYTNHIANLNPIRYRGYYFDVETGLYYLQTRYYDPQVGRFLTPDSVDYLDPYSINGLNLYAYCGNNPIMYTDETGTIPVWGIILIVVGSAIAVNHIVSLIECAVADNKVKDSYTIDEAEQAIEDVLGSGYAGKVKISNNGLKIVDSYKVHSRYKRILISKIYQNTVNEQGEKITTRTTYGLAAEWAGHNFVSLFKRNERTNHVDLDSRFGDNKWYTESGTILFMIFGVL